MSELGIFYPKNPPYKNVITLQGDTYHPFGNNAEVFGGKDLYDIINNNPNAICEMEVTLIDESSIKMYGNFTLDSTLDPGADSVVVFGGLALGNSVQEMGFLASICFFTYEGTPIHWGYLTLYTEGGSSIYLDEESAIPVTTRIYY